VHRSRRARFSNVIPRHLNWNGLWLIPNCDKRGEKADPQPIVESVQITRKAIDAKPAEVKEPKPVKVQAPVPAESDELHKETFDKLVGENGLGEAIAALDGMKVVKLRNLAREYKDFGIAGRMISKADKQMIIAEFKKYYEQKQ